MSFVFGYVEGRKLYVLVRTLMNFLTVSGMNDGLEKLFFYFELTNDKGDGDGEQAEARGGEYIFAFSIGGTGRGRGSAGGAGACGAEGRKGCSNPFSRHIAVSARGSRPATRDARCHCHFIFRLYINYLRSIAPV